ncbi:BMP family ABC transporter substrate-binding protein [Thermaerobacter sp. PB12/4term]|uniref:BMP family lipoprotein n=1 Tax=Thermaerobacter sp. PB12/4term TaxID=2293838 RepID=UPI000E327317|nr:BMP family ABC transporter substrate-binding protein [Thermaerobacter sp. PB12/4term]QIA27224.1 BMP family ABC transporter substrate-binding protein [Thermaerobacter sp. PB12/4term]
MRGRARGRTLGLALMVAGSLILSACGGGGGGSQDQGGNGGGGGQEAKVRVGLVYDVGGRGDQSFNDMAYAGLEKAIQEFGDKVEAQDAEPDAGGQNREDLLRTFADQGYDLVIGVGFLFTDAITAVAKEYPEVKFAIVDSCPEEPLDNVACLTFKEHEGSFLVGAAAALKTQTGTIGFVGGMKTPLIERFEAGYRAGAKYINPDIKVLSDYAGTTGEAFNNPTKGRELALAQIQQGADVIYHAAGGTGKGVFEAVKQQGKLAIGVDADQSLTAPDYADVILTSMVKRVDVAVYDVIRSVVEDNFKAGLHAYGLKEDGVGYAVNDKNRSLIEDITAQLDELKEKIISGEIQVPETPGDV